MKWQLRVMTLVLVCFITGAEAAPDHARQQGPPTVEASAPAGQEDPTPQYVSPAEDAVGNLLLQAISLLGVAYRFGGNSPENGLDCSGFIHYVFQKSLQVSLPRTAAAMAKVGKSIKKSELAPGDLIFFNTRGFNYSHVGMYMGNSKFIHAPRAGKNIEVANISQNYWASRFNGARRVNRGTAQLKADMSNDSAVSVATQHSAKAVPRVKCCKGKKCKPVAVAKKGRGTAIVKKGRKLAKSTRPHPYKNKKKAK